MTFICEFSYRKGTKTFLVFIPINEMSYFWIIQKFFFMWQGIPISRDLTWCLLCKMIMVSECWQSLVYKYDEKNFGFLLYFFVSRRDYFTTLTQLKQWTQIWVWTLNTYNKRMKCFNKCNIVLYAFSWCAEISIAKNNWVNINLILAILYFL